MELIRSAGYCLEYIDSACVHLLIRVSLNEPHMTTAACNVSLLLVTTLDSLAAVIDQFIITECPNVV